MSNPPSIPPKPLAEWLETGLNFHKAGQIGEAARYYNAILKEDPDHPDALHLLGMVFHQAGRLDLASTCLRRAVGLRPDAANYRNSLASLLRDQGQSRDALAQFLEATRLRPESPEILCNLGNLLLDAGDLPGAAFAYRRAATFEPTLADLWYNLGGAMMKGDRSDLAVPHYRRALCLRPDYVDATFNLGNALVRQRRLGESESAFRSAVAARPIHAESHNNLGVVLQETNRFAEAAARFRAALALEPQHVEALFNLGTACRTDDRREEATACFERAVALRPDYGKARFALCMAQLPVLYADVGEIAECRRAYGERLNRLAARVATGGGDTALADAVGSSQPFFLPYQGEDDRELQTVYGTLACRLLAEHRPPAVLPAAPGEGEKIRVGLVSGYFHEHTVWRLFLESWCRDLDRRRFSVVGYHAGLKHDACTDQAAAWCDRFIEGPRSGAQWREVILADAPHVLLYPEVGMDPTSGHLAAQRLAPVQCLTWGQPETTGMATMDYFLTSALMEPEGGEAFYTERLIRLPNLGTCFTARTWPAFRPQREDLGLRPGAVVYWSGQALYKYLPQYDDVFPRIARSVGDCQFVFIDFANSRRVSDRFRARLDRAFAAHGLTAADHCVHLPSMPQEHFINAVRQADVLLDTPDWSGGKSTLDCLAHDAPIVTRPGRFMRGRHTAAILTRIGVPDTIAATIDDYVAIAARLGNDSGWRESLRVRIAAGRDHAFGDRACVTALEDFLVQAVAEAR